MKSLVFNTKNPAFARVVPLAVYVIFLMIESGLVSLQEAEFSWVGEWDLRWIYPVKTIAVAACLAYFWRHYTELTNSFRMRISDWGLAIAVGVGVFVLWINLDQEILMLGESGGFDPTTTDGSLNWFFVISRILGAALVVPLMEELFWRSFLLRWIQTPGFLTLEPARVGLKAFIITAVLFGLGHNLWFAGILAGVAYAWLYMRSGNLWVPVISHAVTNAMLGVWIVLTGNWRFW